MRIRRAAVTIAAAIALMGSLSADAGNNKTKGKGVEQANAYNFSCVGPALNLTLSSFTLPLARPSATAASGASAAAAKPQASALTIEFPASSAYATLYSQILRGDHYSSCTLTEKVDASAGTATLTWTFSQMTPTSVTAIWKEGSAEGSQPAGLPTALVRATLTFSEVRFDDGSGSSSKTATDSWMQTQ